ncbi:type II toxin-antitoxin system RelE/ParE family toxin [Pararhizobium sp. O133]|uniref:type II toxin-antitoxin system RelE/ParE family toxin n=1 Tax=Pararhizobium sp. O133 TaxID=3449278 RepID=UPI003F68876E
MRDLDDLKEWLRRKNPAGFKPVAAQISKTIEPVAKHSAIGRKTLREDIRELVEPRYGFIIPYTIIDNTVFILRIYSAKRYPLDPATVPDPSDPK